MIKFKVLNETSFLSNKDNSNWDKIKHYGKKALPYLAGAALVGGGLVAGLQYFHSDENLEIDKGFDPDELSSEARKVYDTFNGNTPQHYDNLTLEIVRIQSSLIRSYSQLMEEIIRDNQHRSPDNQDLMANVYKRWIEETENWNIHNSKFRNYMLQHHINNLIRDGKYHGLLQQI